MGAGTGPLGVNQVFRIEIEFTDAKTGTPKPLRVGEDVYENFVGAILGVKHTVDWTAVEQPDHSIDGGTLLLRGLIQRDETSQINYALNRILRGLRVKQGGTSTGAAARVVKNIGPADAGSTNHGGERGPDASDLG